MMNNSPSRLAKSFMKKTFFCALAIGALVLTGATARADDDDEDRVTRVDHYRHPDVIHYDHHHRYVYTDEFGSVIGERTVHHDHHYVQPQYRRDHHHPTCGWRLGFGAKSAFASGVIRKGCAGLE